MLYKKIVLAACAVLTCNCLGAQENNSMGSPVAQEVNVQYIDVCADTGKRIENIDTNNARDVEMPESSRSSDGGRHAVEEQNAKNGVPQAIEGPTADRSTDFYRWRIYGVLKAKYENDLESGLHAFSLRNSRLGVRGFVTENVGYTMQIDIAPQGTISVIDAYVSYKFGDIEFAAGQQPFGLSRDVSRGAGANYFVNRSLVAKFLTQYYREGAVPAGGAGDNVVPAVGAIGARDLGVNAKYHFDGIVPFDFSLGFFNGSGISKPISRRGLNMSVHLDAGRKEGFGGSAGYYGGSSMFGRKLEMWSVGLRYYGRQLVVEAEAAQRYQDDGDNRDALTVGVVQALYRFRLGNPVVRSIAPLARFDVGENIKFINTDGGLESFSAQRITAGITIGLSDTEFRSEIRLNYEHYFLKNRPSDRDSNPLLHDKFAVEFLTVF